MLHVCEQKKYREVWVVFILFYLRIRICHSMKACACSCNRIINIYLHNICTLLHYYNNIVFTIQVSFVDEHYFHHSQGTPFHLAQMSHVAAFLAIP